MARLQLFMQTIEASIFSLDSPLYLQTHVIARGVTRDPRYHKFSGDYECFDAKRYALSNDQRRFLAFIDLYPYFVSSLSIANR
jgi:hypothetical protein